MKDTKIHREFQQLTEEIYRKEDALPAKYTFILTNQCNLSCPFCFMQHKKLAYAMTTEDWIEVADQVPAYARVSLTGGEPLLFGGFKKVFRHVAERNICSVISNGVLLDEETIEMMVSFQRFRILSISVDDIGNRNRHMQSRDWTRLKNNIRTFVRLKNESITLDLKTTVLDDNADELFDIHRYCYEVLGGDTHAFHFLKGSPLLQSDVIVDLQDAEKQYRAPRYRRWDVIVGQLEKIRHWNAVHGKKAYILPKMIDLNAEIPLGDFDFVNCADFNPEEYEPCMFPWSSVQINSDGNVIPCLAVSMGNVREKPFPEIFFGPAYREFKKLLREKGTLQGCNRCCWLPPRRVS